MNMYSSGAIKKIAPAVISRRRRPRRSERTPTGKLNRIPANGEIAEISPITASLDPIDCIKSGSTGFFDIVVEKIAKKPKREM